MALAAFGGSPRRVLRQTRLWSAPSSRPPLCLRAALMVLPQHYDARNKSVEDKLVEDPPTPRSGPRLLCSRSRNARLGCRRAPLPSFRCCRTARSNIHDHWIVDAGPPAPPPNGTRLSPGVMTLSHPFGRILRRRGLGKILLPRHHALTPTADPVIPSSHPARAQSRSSSCRPRRANPRRSSHLRLAPRKSPLIARLKTTR